MPSSERGYVCVCVWRGRVCRVNLVCVPSVYIEWQLPTLCAFSSLWGENIHSSVNYRWEAPVPASDREKGIGTISHPHRRSSVSSIMWSPFYSFGATLNVSLWNTSQTAREPIQTPAEPWNMCLRSRYCSYIRVGYAHSLPSPLPLPLAPPCSQGGGNGGGSEGGVEEEEADRRLGWQFWCWWW